MITFILFPSENKVQICESIDRDTEMNEVFAHRFTHRWECQFFYMLLIEQLVGGSLTKQMLHQSLKLKGQPKELNRAQLQRLYASLNQFLSKVPGQMVALKTAPRQTTVGPWELVISSAIRFENREDDNSKNDELTPWQYPTLQSIRHDSDELTINLHVDELHTILSILLKSDAFALHGIYLEALDEIQKIRHFKLTTEAQCLIMMREALWKKRIGQFDTARELTRSILTLSPSLDQGLAIYAQFFLQRIDYDESPGVSYPHLWHSTISSEKLLQTDWRTMPEWHNLRALLARRRLLEIVGKDRTANYKSEPILQSSNILKLHIEALNHFQSAIYLVLQLRNWDQLQAICANIVLHLQSMISIKLATVTQIFKWHGLVFNYADDLNLAQDSAWEYIYFAKFWQDNHEEIEKHYTFELVDNAINDVDPSQEKFYLTAIEKLNKCADDRQVAIMWILYGRYAKISFKSAGTLTPRLDAENKYQSTVEAVQAALSCLFSNKPGLKSSLEAEGYESFFL